MQELSDIEYARIMSALSPDGSPEDRAWVEQWAVHSDDRRRALEQFREARSVLQTAGEEDIAQRMEQLRTAVDTHVAASLQETQPAANTTHTRSDKKQTRWQWVGAIGLTLALIVGALQGIPYVVGDDKPRASDDSEVRIVTTRIGQQVQYRFADGSSALLAPGTTIRYRSDFGVTSRTVKVRGEALFTIAATDAIPFIVQTENAVVRVLGTTFSVRRYATDTVTSVVVAQGKVSVGEKVLTSGDAAIVDRRGKAWVEQGADIRTALAWTTGTLAFRMRPFHDIIPDLERWYGIRIHVTDRELLNAEVTATFLIDAPDRALNILTSVLQADVIRRGDEVIFHPKLLQD